MIKTVIPTAQRRLAHRALRAHNHHHQRRTGEFDTRIAYHKRMNITRIICCAWRGDFSHRTRPGDEICGGQIQPAHCACCAMGYCGRHTSSYLCNLVSSLIPHPVETFANLTRPNFWQVLFSRRPVLNVFASYLSIRAFKYSDGIYRRATRSPDTGSFFWLPLRLCCTKRLRLWARSVSYSSL